MFSLIPLLYRHDLSTTRSIRQFEEQRVLALCNLEEADVVVGFSVAATHGPVVLGAAEEGSAVTIAVSNLRKTWIRANSCLETAVVVVGLAVAATHGGVDLWAGDDGVAGAFPVVLLGNVNAIAGLVVLKLA